MRRITEEPKMKIIYDDGIHCPKVMTVSEAVSHRLTLHSFYATSEERIRELSEDTRDLLGNLIEILNDKDLLSNKEVISFIKLRNNYKDASDET